MATPQAYSGKEPFIFISYAHADARIVMPILQGLQSKGYRIWYDAQIEAGSDWPDYIASKLMESRCVLIFTSKAATDSPHCRKEITFAISQRKDILTVHLDDTPLPPGLAMQLADNQALFYKRVGSPEAMVTKITQASVLDPCRSGTPVRRPAPAAPVYIAPTPAKKSKAPLFIGLGAAAVAVLVLVAVLLWPKGSSSGGLGNLPGTQPSQNFAEAQKGDIVHFGSYEQNNNTSDGAEPISWIVLHSEDGKLLLLSEKGLDCRQYHEKAGQITWEESSLRKWLNDTFYRAAFTDQEQQQVCLTTLTTEGSAETRDYVFSLTEQEAELYAPLYTAAEVTEYARQQGVTTRYWWLRAPWNSYGYLEMDYALTVDEDNDVTMRKVEEKGVAVRPCIWLDTRSADDLGRRYDQAVALAEKGEYQDALDIFLVLGDYKDSLSYCEALPKKLLTEPYAKAAVGDTVSFGGYKWTVLTRQEGRVLLLSTYALEAKDYHQYTLADPGWKDCTLRQWLNEDFYVNNLEATKEEKALILPTTVHTGENPEYGTTGGDDAVDRLFILSYQETMEYLPELTDRLAYTKNGDVPVSWWLRTKGKTTGKAMFVDTYGTCDLTGGNVFQLDSPYYVRPAMWLDIDV